MSSITISQLQVSKTQLSHVETVNMTIDPGKLQANEVLLRIESFGFSANNITYALMGESMGYWGFFPAPEGKGIVPVWGFATVEYSNSPEVTIGERVFGYLPMASHCVIEAGNCTEQSFYDVSSKRKGINSVYDQYVRCAQDPGYNPHKEQWQATFRPLFMTSFVLDDFVSEILQPDTAQVVLTSASSKTAYGTAFLLKQNKAQRNSSYKVIGLTSSQNVAFSKNSGCYDDVLSYDEYASLGTNKPTVVLDFAGNKPLLLSIQSQLNEMQQAMIYIGATDVSAQLQKFSGELKGQLFFAPAQVKKRTEQWGSKGFMQKYAQGWGAFSAHIQTLLNTQEVTGIEQVKALYLQGLAGKFDANYMYIASL